MPGYKIRKKFTIEMAHILSTCYSEECKNIHGHSYTLEIIIETMALNGDGMVIDFKELKALITEKVIKRFDHTLVLQNMDEFGFPEKVRMLQQMQQKPIVIVEYNPTAECMTKDIYDSIFWELEQAVPEMITLVVRLHETATGWAEYTGGRLR